MRENSFTIYDASAGSGKTFTLVKEYLVLLLSSSRRDNYKHILAITFTNKAVAEMKSRIVESLHSLAYDKKSTKTSQLTKILSKETGLSGEEIKEKSRLILKRILHDYASFEVSTIDGFTHRVLRTFAKDLELPLNFEVELNTEEVIAEAVDRLISKAGEDKALTKILVNFVLRKTDDDKSWDISRDLMKIGKLLTQETSQPFLKEIRTKKPDDFLVLSDQIKEEIKTTENLICEIGDKFFQLLGLNGIEDSDFTGGYCPKFFKKVQQKDYGSIGLNAQWQLKLHNQPLYPKKVSAPKKDILDRVQPEIVSFFEDIKKGLILIQYLKAVEKNLIPLSLLSSIQQEVEEIKKENSVVLISEFNATIGQAVKDQPAPFIYERLGERYRHYFIDEFQDTSQLQWENLVPLIDHTLSSDHIPGEFGSLTLVGDAKQSIYRWRGGKAEQFMGLCKEENPFSMDQKRVVVLPSNYRSAQTIVEFNNSFFTYAANCLENDSHEALFKNSAQDLISENQGYVNISFVEAKNVEEEMEVYPKRVLEILRKLEKQNVSKSQVCILTRKKKESIAVASYLSENGISVISAESLLLSRSAEVNFINAVLKLRIDSGDKELKYEVLEYLSGHLGVAHNFNFCIERLGLEGQAFFDSLQRYNVDFSLEKLEELSVYEGVEYIIRSFKLVSDSDAYVQFYLDYVYESSQSEGSGIFEFLELWERKKDDLSIVVPEGQESVQIMTIHRAKGLEFPVVIYPFANSSIKDTAKESFWVNLPEGMNSEIPVAHLEATDKMKDWGGEVSYLYEELCFNSQFDALNVLYVALTRPVQQLYVISKKDINRKGEENPNKFSGLFISYLKHLGKWTGESEYHFGSASDFPNENRTSLPSVEQQIFHSSPIETNGISFVTRAGLLWDSRQGEAIEKGQLVHELFSRINTRNDVDLIIDNSCERGLIKDQHKEQVREMIWEVMEHPQLRQYYLEGVVNYNERSIISGAGEVLRPDRLNFQGSKVSIIDYKTGGRDPKHDQQIDSYAAILKDMGYDVGEKLLVYLNAGTSVRVV